MSNITRICPECGRSYPLEARHCIHCGHDSQASLPVLRNTLPELVGKAAVPVLVGAAGLALSAGWKLLQSLLSQPPSPQPHQPIQVRRPEQVQAAPRGRFSVRITTSWAVGDSSGRWQRGQSEQTIEFDA